MGVSFEQLFDSSDLNKEEWEKNKLFLDVVKEKKTVWLPRARLRCRQKTKCWVELKGIMVKDSEVSQFLLMFRDLSSEIQLAEDYSRLAGIPEESPFPIIEVDAAGHLLFANPSMVHLMEDAHIGKDAFTTALPDQFSELVDRCFAQGNLESNIEVKVGAKHYAWSFSSHAELGRLRGYGMDITASKQAADELSTFADLLESKNHELDHALVKSEAATRAKSAFLATMSHEVRTPLNGVIGMAELLQNSSLNFEQQECITIIRKSGEGLLAIVNDILDLSRLESGNMTLETIGFNPLVLVEEVVDLFSEQAYKKHLDLAAYVAPDIPSQLFGDPHRLRQILSNFISNALKFTNDGFVLVEVSWFPLPGTRIFVDRTEEGKELNSLKEGTVRFSVTDTGIGISQDMQGKIFQVFTQADSSMSRKFGGSGLGLSICKQMAELMNGTVGFESQIGHGARFWCVLSFPLSELQPDIEGEPRLDTNKDILVCSLSDASTEVMSRHLLNRGVRVVRVEQVEEAVKFLEEKQVAPSEVLGVIIGRGAKDKTWKSWLETIRTFPFLNLKVWELTPFWLSQRSKQFSFAFNGMITIPIHRNQLYRCVFKDLEECGVENLNQVRKFYYQMPHEEGDYNSDTSQDKASKTELEIIPPEILVVDDNPVNQKIATGLLKKLDCQVTIAGTGLEAVDVSATNRFDLIFMDWQMPGMDGLEVTRVIRTREQVSKNSKANVPSKKSTKPSKILAIPIIGLTANTTNEDHTQCLDAGMNDFLTKPIRINQLQEVLKKWIPFFQPSIKAMTLYSDLTVNRLEEKLPNTNFDIDDRGQVFFNTDGLLKLFHTLINDLSGISYLADEMGKLDVSNNAVGISFAKDIVNTASNSLQKVKNALISVKSIESNKNQTKEKVFYTQMSKRMFF